MQRANGLTYLSELRRKTYLIVFPLTAAIALLSPFAAPAGFIDFILSPLLALWMGFLSLAVWQRRLPIETIDNAAYLSAVLFFLIKLYHALSVSYLQFGTLQPLMEAYNWIVLVYPLAFLIYSSKLALLASALVFGTTVILGLVHLFLAQQAGKDASELSSLLPFFTASMLLVAFLVFFTRLRERYLVEHHRFTVMKHLAHTDALTTIANRRHMEESLEREIARAARLGQGFSVIMFDIDHFKLFNDRHGHKSGDYVLHTIAQLAKRQLRRSDEVGRWGGEEFLIISPQSSLDQAEKQAERLRRAIESHDFGNVGTITASFGVTVYREGDTPGSLVARAFEALYRAKQGGKNRVEVAP